MSESQINKASLNNEKDIEKLNFINRLRTGTQLAILGFEVSPLNEVARYSAFAVTLAAGADTPTAAAVFGGSTLAIESSAALATAPLLSGRKATSTADKINQRFFKGDLNSDRKIPKLAHAGVALGGGSAISMALKKAEQPATSKEESRAHGIKVSAYLAGATAAQGALMAEGINHPSPEKVGAALATVAGMVAVASWAKSQIGDRKI